MCSNQKERERAKLIIREIIRVSGGEVPSKTHLFKAFYYAHLFYTKATDNYLSAWPVVRMPNGPGIDKADALLSELIQEGHIGAQRVPLGPYTAIRYRSVSDEIPDELAPEAIDAIRKAVEFTTQKTATELSELTHELSRSWNQADNGEELDLYIDLMSDDEYAESLKKTGEIASALNAALG